jgi:hypothetical protein
MPELNSEPFEISLRFYCAIESNALRLETDAQKDQLLAASLQHPGHRRRQNLLVQAQRDDAARFRNFLAQTRIRNR